MLNVYYGDMPESIYNTAVYFRNRYLGRWITDDWGKAVIKDVDKSTVVSGDLIKSPVLGPISPSQLSGGVKTLLLVAHEKNKVFNASTCGDNCAKWLLDLGQKRKVVVNLRHLMDFGKGEFKIRVMNTGRIVHNMKELVLEAGEYV